MSFRVPLSPSRVADFKSCPQLFKFRALDRLPEPQDPYSARGTLVHSVLERLFAYAPHERTDGNAHRLLDEVWAEIRASEEMEGLDLPADEESIWLDEARRLLTNYFRVEDPTNVQPHELEWWVEHETPRSALRGVIDRVEVLPDGEWVLSDYKTGPSPSESRSLGSFFGLRFYALVCWRSFGRMPKALRLVHLREPEVITLVPTEQMLTALERQLEAVSDAIRRAMWSGDWRARRGFVCNWCAHKAVCPAWAEESTSAVASGV